MASEVMTQGGAVVRAWWQTGEVLAQVNDHDPVTVAAVAADPGGNLVVREATYGRFFLSWLDGGAWATRASGDGGKTWAAV